MHLFRAEPCLERLSRLRLTLRNHLSFRHVHNYPLRPRTAAGLHALRKRFGSLPRQARQRMLRKIARHVSSQSKSISQVFHTIRAAAADLPVPTDRFFPSTNS